MAVVPNSCDRYNAGMSITLKAVVRYDGTRFAGWQVQPGQRTVQEDLETALGTIAGETVRITGAGRTDAGVHALGQVFSCGWPEGVAWEGLQRSLSKMLGPEVRIESIESISDDFNALHSAIAKRYTYVLYDASHPDPFSHRYAWSVPKEVDWAAVRRLGRAVEGTHDFAGFCASGSSAKTTVRTIHSVNLCEGPVIGPVDARHYWRLEFHGEGFLYKMVRNLVGSFIEIARGRIPESRLDELLHAPAPYHGFTAPAHGLFLIEVDY